MPELEREQSSSARPAQTAGLWTEQFSIYLDLVRFLAALYVMVAHTKYPRFTDGWLERFGAFASDAVMIFFVLSGLVIAHVTQSKERVFGDYALARLARLWSVALPALVLGLLADKAGQILQPTMYQDAWYFGDQVLIRLLSNAFFSGQLWFSDRLPQSNVPFWSVNYEFWYYCIFAALIFLKGWPRCLALALCGAICGPKILLLLPVWLLGVVCHRLILVIRPSKFKGLCLALLSVLAYAIYTQSGIHGHLNWLTERFFGTNFTTVKLNWSRSFLSDYVVGFLVMLHFLGVAMWLAEVKFFKVKWANRIKSCASFTFSIYLLHMPLLHFSAALIKLQPGVKSDWIIMLALTMGAILAIGIVTEHQKHLAKKILQGILEVLRRTLRPRESH